MLDHLFGIVDGFVEHGSHHDEIGANDHSFGDDISPTSAMITLNSSTSRHMQKSFVVRSITGESKTAFTGWDDAFARDDDEIGLRVNFFIASRKSSYQSGMLLRSLCFPVLLNVLWVEDVIAIFFFGVVFSTGALRLDGQSRLRLLRCWSQSNSCSLLFSPPAEPHGSASEAQSAYQFCVTMTLCHVIQQSQVRHSWAWLSFIFVSIALSVVVGLLRCLDLPAGTWGVSIN